MSVAAFITCQRTDREVPHALACRALNVSQSWYYKWRGRASTARDQRRSRLAGRIAEIFAASGGTSGSPRVVQDLWAEGFKVSVNTVAQIMTGKGWWPGSSGAGATSPSRAGARP